MVSFSYTHGESNRQKEGSDVKTNTSINQSLN